MPALSLIFAFTWKGCLEKERYNFIILTKEDYPRVLIERGRNLEKLTPDSYELEAKYGPFTNGTQLREALKIVRKIFPFRDKCSLGQKNPCFNYQIGLCPGVCIGKITKDEYLKTIKNIKLFFEGKKGTILKKLKKEMISFAKKHEFEKADKVKKTIFALNHIQDVSLIKAKSLNSKIESSLRIEAYDISHLSGTNTVGAMTVIEDGEIKKSEYRRFKIEKSIQNDTAGLKEILERRLLHKEWIFPQIIVVDGGKAQIDIARRILQKMNIEIPVVSVLKDIHHRPKIVLGDKLIAEKYSREILLANSEAHRFAIFYHRFKRLKI